MQSNKSKTGAKIKIQSDNLVLNEVNVLNIHLFITLSYYKKNNIETFLLKFPLL